MKHLYHGSITPGIKVLEPRLRYTPGAIKEPQQAVYASDHAAYCIGHAVPWDSREGFNIRINERGICEFIVPENKTEILQQPVSLYTVPADTFVLLPEVPPKGHNFWSLEPVRVIKEEKFDNVIDAIHHFGGKILYEQMS